MTLRQIGSPIESYDALIATIRLRLAEVGAPLENVSALAGLPDRYISKIINPARSKILGRISLDCILAVLGIRLIPVVDDVAFAPLQARLKPARFHRWNLEPPSPHDAAIAREMKIRVDDIGGIAEAVKVPGLRDVVIVPMEEKAPDNTTTVTNPRRRVRPSEGLAGAI
jgi:hypothetical protein